MRALGPDQLRRAREAARLSQVQLGIRLGWKDGTHVNAIEAGRKGTSPEMVERWLDACGLAVIVRPVSDIDAALSDALSSLPPAVRQDVSDLVSALSSPDEATSQRARVALDVVLGGLRGR